MTYEQVQAFLVRLGTGTAVFIGFWIASRIARGVINRVEGRMSHNRDLLGLLARIAEIALLVFGLVSALGTLGIDVSALVAGLGLTGFALGFAFRDILSNLLAGVLILLYRPFSRGDAISVTGLDGVVAQIDLRYTTLQSADNKMILIPNQNLFTNPITVVRK